MSADDRIDMLARAHRETVDGSSATAARTRAAILRAHAERGARRSWLLMAAAVFLTLVSVPTAWALYTGRLSFVSDTTEDRPEVVTPAPVAEVARPVIPEVPVVEAPVAVPAPVEEPVVATVVEPTPSIESPEETPSGRAPVDPVERRAYEEAHRLHFDDGDAAAAIGAWERYLDRYPRGRFAPEARYNRALALIRVGRRDEAAEALQPFATGAHGDYRRAEATELLEALGSAP